MISVDETKVHCKVNALSKKKEIFLARVSLFPLEDKPNHLARLGENDVGHCAAVRHPPASKRRVKHEFAQRGFVAVDRRRSKCHCAAKLPTNLRGRRVDVVGIEA
jgi:hypothetical protein